MRLATLQIQKKLILINHLWLGACLWKCVSIIDSLTKSHEAFEIETWHKIAKPSNKDIILRNQLKEVSHSFS